MPRTVCRGCGAEALRTLARYDERMNFLGECCQRCEPGMFEVYRDPSDKKIYAGPEAYPHLYKRDNEGVYHAKDELLQDTVDNWDEGPTAKSQRLKRTNRRTAPLSADEIAQANRWAKESGLEAAVKKEERDAAMETVIATGMVN